MIIHPYNSNISKIINNKTLKKLKKLEIRRRRDKRITKVELLRLDLQYGSHYTAPTINKSHENKPFESKPGRRGEELELPIDMLTKS